MVDVTGAYHHDFGGKSYTLRLTPLGISRLQAIHGATLGGILTGVEDAIPNFGILVGVVTEGLKKGEGMAHEDAEALADEMLALDMQLAGKVLTASFPDASGNAKAPTAKRKR